MATTRRGFLGSMLALAAAPMLAGFVPTQIAVITSNGNLINVLDYGADPTGTTCSALAIQAAFEAASLSGGRVMIPGGTYLM